MKRDNISERRNLLPEAKQALLKKRIGAAWYPAPTLTDLADAMGKDKGAVAVPPNGILPDIERITPDMLPLITLEQGDIDRIVESTPGGAANIQDIYPLAPLQEGILFHHLMSSKGDVYLLPSILSFDSRELLDSYLGAVQAVINRHDILRTAILWEGLAEPVQVVWREARMAVEQVRIDASAGDAVEQLKHRFDQSRTRIDIRIAPMMCAYIAHDGANDRWLMIRLHHHLIKDHHSKEIFDEEVRAHLTGKASLLPAVIPFRNFVAQARFGVSREAHEAFFRRMLEGVEAPTAPFGLTDLQGDGSEITEASLQLDIQLSRRLRKCARILGVSAARVFHLAWARVLACLSGRDDVVFGTVLSGRIKGGPGADRAMGMYINTLPVRIDIKGVPVDEAIKNTHRILAELIRHQHSPLVLAQRCSDVPASMPLFASLINYRHVKPPHSGEEADVVLEGIEVLHNKDERTNYPLVLSVDDSGEDFTLTANVQMPFEPMRVCVMMNTVIGNLTTLLEEAPYTSVESVEVMSQSDRRQALFDWNATEGPISNELLQTLFQKQVHRRFLEPAVITPERTLSYKALFERANQVGHWLRERDAQPNQLVAVVMEKGWEQIVGVLGVLVSGAAYLPIDATLPQERLWYLLEHGQVSSILTQSRHENKLKWPGGLSRLCIDKMDGLGLSEKPLEPVQKPEDLAYVIYTSGSTGLPKGVMIDHRGAVNTILDINERFSVKREDRVLALSALNFDLSVYDIFGILSAGGTIVIPGTNLERDPSHWFEMIVRHRVTIWNTVPALMQMLADYVNGRSEALPDCMRLVMMSGDWIPINLPDQIRAIAEDAKIISLGGATEASIWSILYPIEQVDPSWASIPYGRPMRNQSFYVLNEALSPCPVWIPGKLYIGGVGLAKGYWRDEEKTGESFITHSLIGERLYRTGDLGRYLPDGNIEFLGREDFQVKIRGYRIELGEIEIALMQHPGIHAAVVTTVGELRNGKRLAAYYICKKTAEAVTAEQLRSYLSGRLPEYMLPSSYTLLKSFPQTANGKIDRKALPALAADSYLTPAYESPEGELEETLSRIWSGLLGVEKVGRRDSFFDLGGHSLLATRMIAQLRCQYQMEIPFRSIFEAPTVAGFASVIACCSTEKTKTVEELDIINELDDLSDEEAAKLLEAESRIPDI